MWELLKKEEKLLFLLAKESQAIYKQPTDVYQHFVNCFMITHTGFKMSDTHKKAQAEWRKLKQHPSLLAAIIQNGLQVYQNNISRHPKQATIHQMFKKASDAEKVCV